jgi:hypothetical protein
VTEEIGWSYVTRVFRALDFVFSFRATDPRVGQLLEHLYAPCAARGDPDIVYSVVGDIEDIGDLEDGRAAEIRINDVATTERHELSDVVNFLTWHVNREVIRRSSRLVLLHAAAAVVDGIAVLLPGVAEAGKTTLVAGLIRSGFDYLTDEAAGIRPEDLAAEPYPKPLTIDPGSWAVLPDLAPKADEAMAGLFSHRWYVNPQRLRGDAIAHRTRPRLIVFPMYVEGTETTVTQVARTDALVELMGQTFHFGEAGRRNFDVLGRLVQQVACYRLVSGDLETACRAVRELADAATERCHGRGPE